MSTDTWLKSITLNNFRCFGELSVEFDRRLTVLVAQNGAGKTTVLDAIAISLSAFVGAFHNGRRSGIERSDVSLKVIDSEILEMEAQYPSSLFCDAEIVGQDLSWSRCMNTPKSKNTYKEANPVISIGETLQRKIASHETNPNIVLPVIAHYGTGRLWKEKKETESKLYEIKRYSRTAGYLDCLDPNSSYKYFVKWLRETSEAHIEVKQENIQRFGDEGYGMETPYETLLNGLTATVDICLDHTGWHGLRYSKIHQNPVVEHSIYGVLEVQQLSDGIRNMIAMVADIACKALRLNKQFREDAPRLSPGIVLIDEVDMHLHPEWQQLVLQRFGKAFPKMQFIVTTHSPQVLSSIGKKNIRLLTTNIDGKRIAAEPSAESYARSNAHVLETVMHTKSTPNFDEIHKLETYRNLVEQGDLGSLELEALRQELEKVLGSDYPDLVRLDKVKIRRELLG